MRRCGTLREETGENDWYRYFGRSTVHTVGGSGSYVYGIDLNAASEGSQTGEPEENPGRLGADPEGYKIKKVRTEE